MIPSSIFCDSCGAENQSQASYCRTCGHSINVIKPTRYHSATGHLLSNIILKQRYHIIEVVGKGGMGAVYRAEDTQLGNRPVAIKEMSQSNLGPQGVKGAADAFRQEAIMLAGLHHPNLPSIFDHFEENGRWYLIMSFIRGETLANYLDRASGKKLPLPEVLHIGIQLCNVLEYLHNQQPPIIFRDLKTSNIMRTSDGNLYLIDFGIARHFKPGQAKDTAYYGSMGYSPPEQFGRAQTTERSDIYSLGVVLYQLVSGYDPFATPFDFPPLQTLVPTVPNDFAALVTQMLNTQESSRPASIAQVKQRLQAIAMPGMPAIPSVSAGTQTVFTPSPQPSAPAQPLTQPASPQQLPAFVTPAYPTYPPTQFAAPQSALSFSTPVAQLGAKAMSMWTFGKKQIIATIISAVIYGILSILYNQLDYSLGTSVFTDVFIGVLFTIVIFEAIVYGPLVTGIATFAGIFVVNQFLYVLHWYSSLAFVIVGIVSGLALFALFHKRDIRIGKIVVATLMGMFEIAVALAIIYGIDSFLYPIFSPSQYLDAYVFLIPPTILPCLILLPIFLIIYRAIEKNI